jgi:ABC-type spermidine/putrescine transport system permease subunit I
MLRALEVAYILSRMKKTMEKVFLMLMAVPSLLMRQKAV